MARNNRKKQKATNKVALGRGKNYTAGEIFGAVLGAAMLILFGGIILTAFLGE